MNAVHGVVLVALAVVSAAGFLYAMVGLLILDARTKR